MRVLFFNISYAYIKIILLTYNLLKYRNNKNCCFDLSLHIFDFETNKQTKKNIKKQTCA